LRIVGFEFHGPRVDGTARLPILAKVKEVALIMPPSSSATLAGGQFDPPLDTGIADIVHVLRAGGVETFESCEGGVNHAYPEPTVRFHGEQPEGYRALSLALYARLPVRELRRVWPVIDGEPTGPWWELTFAPTRNR